MRRITLILLACLLCMSIISALAEETEEFYPLSILDQAERTIGGSSQLPPLIQYNEESGKIMLLATPSPLAQYMITHIDEYSNQYANFSCKINLKIDVSFDGGDWSLTKIYDKPEDTYYPFTQSIELTPENCKQIAIELIDLDEYDVQQDSLGFLSSIVSQNNKKNVINFNEHTMQIKLYDAYWISVNGESESMSNETGHASVYTNNSTQVNEGTPAPLIMDTVWNTIDKQLLIQMKHTDKTQFLMSLQHPLTLKAQWMIIDKPEWTSFDEFSVSEEFNIPIGKIENIIITPPIEPTISDEGLFGLKLALYDEITQTQSNWLYLLPQTKTTSGFDNTSATIIDSTQTQANKNTIYCCNLCKDCTWHPANICMWMWIGMIVFGAISMATAIWLTCVIIKQRKVKED